MAIGPLGRIVAQFFIVAASSVGRAMLQAYRDAAKKGTGEVGRTISGQRPLSLRSRMTAEEARRILGLDSTDSLRGSVSVEEVKQRHKRLYEINAPTGAFSGSPYLQKKVNIARMILLEDIAERTEPPRQHKDGSTGATPEK